MAGEGVWSVDAATGAITFTPAPDYAGPVTPIAYTIADSEGLRSAPASVGVTITSNTSLSIIEENQKAGVAQSIWDAPISNQIEGFATDISYDTGDLVSFKINLNTTQSAPYHIEIYRLGYYGGDGATLVDHTRQPHGLGATRPDHRRPRAGRCRQLERLRDLAKPRGCRFRRLPRSTGARG